MDGRLPRVDRRNHYGQGPNRHQWQPRTPAPQSGPSLVDDERYTEDEGYATVTDDGFGRRAKPQANASANNENLLNQLLQRIERLEDQLIARQNDEADLRMSANRTRREL